MLSLAPFIIPFLIIDPVFLYRFILLYDPIISTRTFLFFYFLLRPNYQSNHLISKPSVKKNKVY